MPSDEPVVTAPGGIVASNELIVSPTAAWRNAQRSGLNTGIFLVKDLSAAPEPSTWMLMGMGMGLVGLFGVSRRRQPS